MASVTLLRAFSSFSLGRTAVALLSASLGLHGREVLPQFRAVLEQIAMQKPRFKKALPLPVHTSLAQKQIVSV